MNKLLLGLIVAGVFSRLIPHAPNFTALGAAALLSGVVAGPRIWALLVPMISLFVSDLILGFHSTMWSVYLAMTLTVLLGRNLKNHFSWTRLGGVALANSLVFFLLTNFAVWWSEGLYTHNLAGLIECYVMAIPFFANQVMGDVVFVSSFFALWAWAKRPTQIDLFSRA